MILVVSPDDPDIANITHGERYSLWSERYRLYSRFHKWLSML